jgi:hypothetical protein
MSIPSVESTVSSMETEAGEQPLQLEQFAARLLHAAVTPRRLANLVADLVGDEVRFGPVDVGPGGIASATGRGRRGEVTAYRVGDELGMLTVRIPLAVRVTVRLPMRLIRFRAQAAVQLHLRVIPCAPLAVNIAITDPCADDIVLTLSMSPFTRALMAVAGDVESILVRYIREYVRDMVNSPRTRRYTHIDLADLIDRAWENDLIRQAS